QGEGRHLVALGAGRQRVDPLPVGGRVDLHQLGDLLVAERLRVADQCHRGGEALEVPGEGPTYASSKSLTLKTRRPLESMYVPKFSACRSPWIHTREVRSSRYGPPRFSLSRSW